MGADCRQWFAGLAATAMLLTSPGSHAASGFIASTEVSRGDVYAEIRIRFNCDVVYAGHDPSGKTDAIRIHLEATSICRGVPPIHGGYPGDVPAAGRRRC